jgi:hypothetical protein
MLFSCAVDGIPRLVVGGAAAFRLAFVPLLLTFGERKFELDLPIFEVHTSGNERKSFNLRFADQLANFFLVEQQFSGAKFGMIGEVPMVIGSNMTVEEPQFSVFDQPVGIFEIRLARSDRFDLGAGESDSCLEFFKQEVVMTRVPIDGGILFARRGGLAGRIFLPAGLSLMGGLLGHECLSRNYHKGPVRGLRSKVSGLRKTKPVRIR